MNKNLLVIIYFVFISFTYASSNKESFKLFKEDFSTGQDINYQAIYKHISYKFTDQDYLTKALHPLLPKRLKHPKKDFEHLEFLGDAVLGVIIRERILALFSEDERRIHCDLYVALTQNKTLSSVFINKLKGIQAYLPYPEDMPSKSCKYCNVLEALIGAIYKDSDSKGIANSRKFIMRVLDDHILKEKWQEMYAIKSTKTSTIASPKVRSIIESATKNLNSKNPKSILTEILTQLWQDSPCYKISLSQDNLNNPCFIAIVEGSQIGHIIKGLGSTISKAEEAAARNAINFLAQENILTPTEDQTASYTKIVNEYAQYKQLKITNSSQFSLLPFKVELRIGDQSTFEGVGVSKAEAKESAAKQACYQFLINESMSNRKNYRVILREWSQQEEGRKLEYLEKSVSKNIFLYKLDIVGAPIFEEQGDSKEEARENAHRKAFEYLLTPKSQPQNSQDRNISAPHMESTMYSISSLSLKEKILTQPSDRKPKKERDIKSIL